ncbi:MAG TPA: hypothetical protein VE753_08650 [Gaiellaceae bacterium]|nr:hypothetical protein [Gaiellaceae bacterium]
MRGALVAAAVAVAAVAGVIVAVVVSSGSGSEHAAPGSTAASTPAATTATPTGTGATTRTGAATTATTATTTAPTTSVRPPPPPAPGSSRARSLIVGVVDDALAQRDPGFARSQVDLSHRAGFGAAMVSATWKRGQRRPSAGLVHVLRNVAAAARQDHMRLFVMVWHGLGPATPRRLGDRAAFAAFAAHVAQAVPHVYAIVVGNEPNLNTFWKPQFGPGGRDLAAVGYERLLADCYDAIRRTAPRVLVLGGALSPRGADRPHGTRPTHSPTSFIRDLGRAYRASGRDRPLMDGFAMHPYMQFSRVSPREGHPRNTSITIADYPKLVALLDDAFRGTVQPGARLPVYYTEFGVQTAVPRAKRSFYTDAGSPASADRVGFGTQADYYRQALALAYCQPTVKALFIFHTFDEADLAGWQSGLYFADRTPKPSLRPFRRAVADLRAGKLTTCR